MPARALILLCLFGAACKFEPIGATVTGRDGGEGGARDANVVPDADVHPDAAELLPDAAERDASEPNDAGLPPRTIYFPSAGGGEVSSDRHRATLIVGGSAAPRTSTSTTYRVQFGGAAR